MGKTKIKTIDDSPQTEPHKDSSGVDEVNAGPVIQQKKSAQKTQKPGKRSKIRSKKYLKASESVDKTKLYSIPEAVSLVKTVSYSKYPATLEIHINSNVKNLRGILSLPYYLGKKLKVLAFGNGAQDSGADQIGDEEKISEIGKGKIDFDVLIATPEWMTKLAKVAKVLGPKGLMPNPKNGTITNDLKKTAEELQSGKVEYKSEKNVPVIHLALGKLTQPDEELSANIKILLSHIGKSKIKKATIAPTLGPGIKLDYSSI